MNADFIRSLRDSLSRVVATQPRCDAPVPVSEMHVAHCLSCQLRRQLDTLIEWIGQFKPFYRLQGAIGWDAIYETDIWLNIGDQTYDREKAEAFFRDRIPRPPKTKYRLQEHAPEVSIIATVPKIILEVSPEKLKGETNE